MATELGDIWPLARLQLRLGDRLQLVVPDEAALLALAGAAHRIVAGAEPFLGEWSDGTPTQRAQRTLLHHWRQRGQWTPQSWCLDFAVVYDGEVVGTQGLAADDFAVTREVRTGSWLTLRQQGRGIGTAMRVAVLAFAFEHLGAESATSAAHVDNPASQRVSRTVGYRDDGVIVLVRGGERVADQRFRLDRTDWTPRGDELVVEGFEGCRDFFGLPAP